MDITKVSGVYAIIDPEAVGDRDPARVLDAVLAAGISVAQLRAKVMQAREMCELAREMARRCEGAGALFIVNDRLDVAMAVGAGGVHLGQDDLPLAAARLVAPEGMAIGVSTHTVEEALAAEAGGADYIGFGAIYATGTKPGVTRPRGPKRLREVVEAVSIPVVAIGGIDAGRLEEVKSAGAAGAAVISAICGADDPGRAAREMVETWAKAVE